MEILACKTCSSCVDVGIKCTDACLLGDCENRAIIDDEDNDDLKEDIAVNKSDEALNSCLFAHRMFLLLVSFNI